MYFHYSLKICLTAELYNFLAAVEPLHFKVENKFHIFWLSCLKTAYYLKTTPDLNALKKCSFPCAVLLLIKRFLIFFSEHKTT